MTKIFVIILHYKGQKDTLACLQSLDKLTSRGFTVETTLVNNSPQENLSGLSKKFPQTTLLNNSQNLGFAAGNNVGLKYALKNQADYVLLLNNDTLVKPDFLQKLLQAAQKHPRAGILVPKIYFAPGFEFHQDRYQKKDQGKVIWYAGGKIDWANIATRHIGVDQVDQGQFEKTTQTEFVTGCALFARASILKEIGLLDPKYFLYYEDADLGQRAQKAGYQLLFVPQAVIWHKVAASSQIGGDLHDYFLVRNQLLFGLRYAPVRSKLALIKQSARFLFFGRPWQKRGVLDFYLNRFGKGSWQ